VLLLKNLELKDEIMKAKIGIEIHQRLEGEKLFCKCSTKQENYLDIPYVYRELRPIASETGEIDIAALMQAEKGNGFYYFTNRNTCLLELDEQPPEEVNRKALLTAINVALQMNMKLPDSIIFMRKIIIDGSNTSGFQRTALIGIDGNIKVQNKLFGIQTLSLEEESAGIISENIFRLDRLGVPLLEISTKPDMSNGKEAREVAETIGLMLRSLPYTARGIGTIRQDLNVSIEGGARVELKGAQELYMIEKWIENEIKRQQDLIKIVNEIKKRGIKENDIKKANVVDITNIFLSYEKELGELSLFIKNALNNKEKVYALRMERHKGLLGMECGKRRYGSELSDYAKIAGIGGIIHSDEHLDKYGINKKMEQEIRKALSMNENDAFIIAIGKEEKLNKALTFVKIRASTFYIPEETRKVNYDASSTFMRPLPGRARMYPETDVPYIFIDEKIKNEALSIAEPFYMKIERLEKMLNKELAYKILKGRHLFLFEELSKYIDPVIVAVTLEDTIVKIRREKGIEVKEENIREVLFLYKDGKITKKGIEKAIIMLENGMEEKEILNEIGRIKKEELRKIYEKVKDKKEIMKKYGLRIEQQDLESL